MSLFRRRATPQAASPLERYAAIYPRIGAELQRALPPGWSTAWACAEIDDLSSAMFVYYLDAAGAVGWIVPPLRLLEHCAALRDAARSAEPSQPWTTATFVLRSDGTFTVDYGYEPVPIADEVERRARWKAQYLPRAR